MEETTPSRQFEIKSKAFEPAYLKLHRKGELECRAEAALQELEKCRVCPRNCDVNRLENKIAACKSGRFAFVGSYFPHFGEEDCLRGWNGSGTIFFSMCNLKCVFCQNFDISQDGDGRETAPKQLAGMMLALQERRCHNINFVTPEHVVPQILEALPYAVEAGLRLPIVYNTSAYDSVKSLKLMDGVVDIYMPDFKFWTKDPSKYYLKAMNYPQAARTALTEMQRQVGDLTFDEFGLAKRGVLVRHLVMPGYLADTRAILRFLAKEISPHIYLNLMDQYHPAGKVSAKKHTEINRAITANEYKEAMEIAQEEGIYRLDSRRLQNLLKA